MTDDSTGNVTVVHDVEKNGVDMTIVERPIPSTTTKPAPTKKKLAHTNYFLTVSTNERFTDFQENEYQAAAKRLHDAFYYVLDNLDTFIAMPEGESFAKPYVKDVYTDMAIELSPSKNHLHLHSIIMISHYSRISVNFKAMKEVFNQKIFGEGDSRSVYFYTKWFNSAKESLETYITKNQTDLRRQGVAV